MRVPRIAIRAAEGAPDIRIDRPKAHLGRFRVVQNRPGRAPEVLDVLLLADYRQRTSKRRRIEQRSLLNLGSRPNSHRQTDLRDRSSTLPNKRRRFKPAQPGSPTAENAVRLLGDSELDADVGAAVGAT